MTLALLMVVIFLACLGLVTLVTVISIGCGLLPGVTLFQKRDSKTHDIGEKE